MIQNTFPYCCCKLHTLYFITGLIHAFLAAVTMIVAIVFECIPSVRLAHVITPVTQTIGLWTDSSQIHSSRSLGHNATLDSKCQYAGPSPSRMNDVSIVPVVLSYGELKTQFMIPSFFLLSALFQCSYPIIWAFSGRQGSHWSHDYYKELDDGKIHKAHFIEYSLSASLMMLIIYAQLGITDLSVLALSFTATWACMMFGLLAELFSEVKINLEIFVFRIIAIPAQFIAHGCGWVVLFVTISVAISGIQNYITCVDGYRLPDFVMPIVAIEVILFSSFGIVQAVSLYRMYNLRIAGKHDEGKTTAADIAYTAEYSYVMLSLLAKTTLALGIFTGLYQTQQSSGN